MSERDSRFAPRPVSPLDAPPRAELYPERPMQRWHVRFVVEGAAWECAWKHDVFIEADSSTDAVGRARDDFFGTWATLADRQRYPLRVVELRQVDGV